VKKYLQIAVSSFLSFLVLTFSTATIETASDGNDTYGFPFTFFKRLGGKCSPCPPSPAETNYWHLSIDIIVSVLLGFAVWAIYSNIKNTWLYRKRNP